MSSFDNEKHTIIPSDHREEVTGLMEGVDFFRLAQQFLPETDKSWCVISIDVEHYKLFVDWFGLESGSRLLSRMGEILRREADETGGLAGYMGLDHFCLLTKYDSDRIKTLYDKLQTVLFSVSSSDGFSILFGIAVLDGSYTQIRSYYNNAAMATEEIKDNVQIRISVYDPEIHRKRKEEYRLLHDFRSALERGEICFWLQPQCRISNGKIIGAESLARWRMKDGSYVSPAVFVPILEKYKMIPVLDRHIWESVCKWLRKRLDSGHMIVPISVNVSQIDIFSFDVPAYMKTLIETYDLPAGSVKLEITESVYAENMGVVGETVSRLREQGLQVMMDDFGSGYSSLNMLSSVKVDAIKLDAQFLHIREEEEKKGLRILESIVNMTKRLATPIIVEGVEYKDQVQFLADLGCQFMQGFFLYRPMPVSEFEALIDNNNSIDSRGIGFKANQQIRVKEFLDENLFTDVMLNNVLGPVAFYSWHGDDIDIIRYNEQFYKLIGLEPEVLSERQKSIQQFLHPDDIHKMFSILEYAYKHHAVGATGVIRAMRPNGVYVWHALKIYFIGEEYGEKRFYASVQDVSELQFISSDLPGGYYRCTTDEEMEFLFISETLRKMTGFTDEEIYRLFDNKLINMVHPVDVPLMLEQSEAMLRGESVNIHPYRIRCKTKSIIGDYIYVADQCHLTDRFGVPCWQGMMLDVTDVMVMRNKMRILYYDLPETILFLRKPKDAWEYEIVTNGLADKTGIGEQDLLSLCNSGQLGRFLVGFENVPENQFTDRLLQELDGTAKQLSFRRNDGTLLKTEASVIARCDARSTVRYIVVFR